MSQRFNAGQPLVIVGAVALFVSLFLDWYEPALRESGVSAWTAFEILDVVLAGLVLVALAAALPIRPAEVGRATVASSGWLPWLGVVTLGLVVVTLINDPPGVRGHALEVGAWIGLAGAALLGIGGILSTARISLVVSGRAGESTVAADPVAESAGYAEPEDRYAPAEPEEPYSEPEPELEADEPYSPPTEPVPTEESPTEESPAARPEPGEE